MSVENGDGTYTTRPWTKAARQDYIEAGGFFLPGLHDLANEKSVDKETAEGGQA